MDVFHCVLPSDEGVSFIMILIVLMRTSPHDLITAQRRLLQIHHLEIRFQYMDLGDTNIQSIAPNETRGIGALAVVKKKLYQLCWMRKSRKHLVV